jgi:hypothetical protein
VWRRRAAQPHDPRGELALELGELGDLAGLDELAQLGLDAPADPAQAPDAPRAHELGDADRGGADRLGRAPVRARGVGVRVGQLEQGGKGVEPIGHQGVVHDRQCSRPGRCRRADALGRSASPDAAAVRRGLAGRPGLFVLSATSR